MKNFGLVKVSLVGLLALTHAGCGGINIMAKQIKMADTCEAAFLTKSEARVITESSQELEKQADNLLAVGSYELAVKKYAQVGAQILKENRLAFEQSADWKLLQRLAELQFKVGRSYAQLGKNENALNCFSQSLKYEIASPNDAMTYINRGDAYRNLGKVELARADYLKASELFKKYKLPEFIKIADDRLKL
jgi:tetratricopeptide (TPR) repeat protein